MCQPIFAASHLIYFIANGLLKFTSVLHLLALRSFRESYTRNGVGVGHFQAKSPLTYFQTTTHQISLFASLNTFNNFYLYKTQEQPIMSLSR